MGPSLSASTVDARASRRATLDARWELGLSTRLDPYCRGYYTDTVYYTVSSAVTSIASNFDRDETKILGL